MPFHWIRALKQRVGHDRLNLGASWSEALIALGKDRSRKFSLDMSENPLTGSWHLDLVGLDRGFGAD